MEGQDFSGWLRRGYQMAKVAAARLLDDNEACFTGADMSTKLKLMGIDVASLGDAHGSTPGSRICSFVDERRRIYKKLVVSEDGQRLIGGILVGDAQDYGTLLSLMQNGLTLPESLEQLLVPATQGAPAPAAFGVAALPAAAQICSCNSVSKGDLSAAVAAGAITVGALKEATKAATSCGGCAALVTQILKAELLSRGAQVNDHLCEHFPYSRQQLFHLVRIGRFAQFRCAAGQARCRFRLRHCKPTAASIFASCWNEFVLTRDKAPLQDSNDYFLANIQKNGTYSIVPRVAAGEITPQQLITIGQIAQKFQLYTKITGGQRIDMFGAKCNSCR